MHTTLKGFQLIFSQIIANYLKWRSEKGQVYAIYAMLIWGIGTAFRVIPTFFLAIPNTISALIPPQTNPDPTTFPVNPIAVFITVVVGYAAFWRLFSLVMQRDI